MSTVDLPIRIPLPTIVQEPLHIDPEIQKIQEEVRNNLNIYDYFKNISPELILLYCGIIFFSVFLVTGFNVQLNTILGIIMGVLLSFFINEYINKNTSDLMKTTEIKMKSFVPQPLFFYMDANIIDLFYELLDVYEYNPKDFESAIKTVDNFLSLRLDVENGMDNCDVIYDVCDDLAKKAINHISFIYLSLPSEPLYQEKTKNITKTLQLYLQRHLDFIAKKCQIHMDLRGLNHKTKIVDQSDLGTFQKNELF